MTDFARRITAYHRIWFKILTDERTCCDNSSVGNRTSRCEQALAPYPYIVAYNRLPAWLVSLRLYSPALIAELMIEREEEALRAHKHVITYLYIAAYGRVDSNTAVVSYSDAETAPEDHSALYIDIFAAVIEDVTAKEITEPLAYRPQYREHRVRQVATYSIVQE